MCSRPVSGVQVQRFEAGQPETLAGRFAPSANGRALNSVDYGLDVFGGRAATASHQVHHAVVSDFPKGRRGCLGCFIVAAKLIRKTRIGDAG